MNTITEAYNSLCEEVDFPKQWDYDDIVVYALNFTENNADAINEDFKIIFSEENQS